jgi:hypothetical protein
MTPEEERGYLAAAIVGAIQPIPGSGASRPQGPAQSGTYAAIRSRLSTLPYAFFGKVATKR